VPLLLSLRSAVAGTILGIATSVPLWAGAPPHAAATGAALAPGVAAVTEAATATGRNGASVSVDLVPAAVLGRRPPTVRGVGAFDFARRSGRVEITGSAGTEKVIFLPEAIFIRQPPPSSGASPLPAGRSWVSAGLNEQPGPGSGLPLFVDQVEVVNVGLILEEIRWGAVAARSLGPAPVGGVLTQGYAVTVNLRQAQRNAVGVAGRDLTRVVDYQVQAISRNGAPSATLRMDVWLAPSGKVARLKWSPPGGGIGTTSLTMSDLRAQLRVSAPSPSQTVDVATLSPAGEKEGGLGDVA
jgi:hypothetical protein